MLECILALLILLFCSPLIIIIIISILLEGLFSKNARGPILYSEERYSHGRPFQMYKFRTFSLPLVKKNSKIEEAAFGITAIESKKENITCTGRVLKKFYLDELPQLINIVRGEMGFVGPRPLIRPLYEKYKRNGNLAKDSLKAGWTGPWQSQKGSIHSMEEIIKAENAYLERVSRLNAWQRFWYDLGIILKSFKVVFEGKSI